MQGEEELVQQEEEEDDEIDHIFRNNFTLFS